MKKLIFILMLLISFNAYSQSEYGHGNQSRAKPVPTSTDAKTKIGALSFIEDDSTVHVGLGTTTQQVATAGDSIIFGNVYTDTLGEATSGYGVNVKSDFITLANVLFNQGSSEKSYWTDSDGDTVLCADPNATAGPTIYFMDDTGADTVQLYHDGTDFKVMMDAGTGVFYINDDFDVDGVSTLDSLNVDGGELIVAHTDDYVEVGHDLIVADSVNVNAGDVIISDNRSYVYLDDSLNVDTGTLIVSHTHEKIGLNDATIDSVLSVSGGGHFSGGIDIDKNLNVDGITDLDTLNVGGGELIVAETDDFVSVGHDLIVADSLNVNGDQFVISDEDNTVIINNTVADTEDPTIHYYYDADSDGSETSNGHLSISGTAASNPASSYIEIDADDVGLGLKINGKVGIGRAPFSTADLLCNTKISVGNGYDMSMNSGQVYYGSGNYNNITFNQSVTGGAYKLIYESGSTGSTGGQHEFYIDDSSAVFIDSLRHVNLYSESNAGAQANASWYLTQGDQMNFANASGGYVFDTDLTIGDSLNINAGDVIVSDNDGFVYLDDSLNVDTGTFIVSHTHEKVGINDATIDSSLTVNGGGHFVGGLLVDKTIEGTTLTDGTASLTGGSLSGASLADGVTATTQSSGDNSTKVATTAYVDAAGDSSWDYANVNDSLTMTQESLGHGMTTLAGTDKYFKVSADDAADGGARVLGLSTAADETSLHLSAAITTTPTTAPMRFEVGKQTGTTWGLIASDAPLYSFCNASVDLFNISGLGKVGLYTSSTDKSLEINKSDGGEIRLTYDDSDGSAANHADMKTDSDGGLNITTTDGDGAKGNVEINPDGNVVLGGATGSDSTIVNGTLTMDYTGSNESSAKVVYKKTIAYDTRGSAQNVILLPENAVVWSIKVEVTTLFNGTGTDLLDIGVTGTGAHYKDDLDVSSSAWTTTMDGNIPDRMTGSTQIIAQYFDANADADAGSADIYVEYTIH